MADWNARDAFAPRKKVKTRKEIMNEYMKADLDEMNFAEKLMVSAGRTFDKRGAGIADLYDRAGIYLNEGKDQAAVDMYEQSRAERKTEQDSNNSAYDYLKDDSPVISTIGEMLPDLATIPIGLGIGGAKAATHIAPKTGALQTLKEFLKPVLAQTATGAAEGGAHYDDTALSGAAWGAAGGVAGQWLGNLLGGNARKLNPEDAKTIKFAKDKDLYVPSGMGTGNVRLQQMDRALQTHSSTADKVHDALVKSKYKENNIISKELGGETADILSRDYLAGQRTRIADTMNDLVKDTSGKFDESHAFKITDIIDNFKSTDPGQASRKILDNVEDMVYDMQSSGKELTGEAYQAITSKLNKAANKQFKSAAGDEHLGFALSDMSKVFNEAIETGMPDSTVPLWSKANREYALLEAIEKAKDKTTQVGRSGVSGFVDTTKLSKIYKSSKVINDLSDVEKLRRSQPGSSLSTSGLLGRMMNVSAPMDQIGAGLLLSSRLTEPLPIIPDIMTSLYMKGYPHSSGILPLAGRKTKDAVANATGAALRNQALGQKEDESGQSTNQKIDESIRKILGI